MTILFVVRKTPCIPWILDLTNDLRPTLKKPQYYHKNWPITIRIIGMDEVINKSFPQCLTQQCVVLTNILMRVMHMNQ